MSADQYEEVDDILKRHKTLATTNADLKESLHKETVRLEELREKLGGVRRESQNLVLVQNSQVHSHQRAIEELRSNSVKVEAQREVRDRTASLKLREYGQVVMSIKNLCVLACVRAYSRACVRTRVRACVLACVRAYSRTCVLACVRACARACVRACVCARVPVCACGFRVRVRVACVRACGLRAFVQRAWFLVLRCVQKCAFESEESCCHQSSWQRQQPLAG